jgi:hypothetical protein
MKFIVIDYVDEPVIITDAAGNVRIFEEYNEATDAARDDATNGMVVMLKKDATPLLRDIYTMAKEEIFSEIPEGMSNEEILAEGITKGGMEESEVQLLIRLKEIGE